MNSESRWTVTPPSAAHLAAEGLDAVRHRYAVAQQVLDAVRAGGRPDQRDGSVQDPDEIDRIVVRADRTGKGPRRTARPRRAGSRRAVTAPMNSTSRTSAADSIVPSNSRCWTSSHRTHDRRSGPTTSCLNRLDPLIGRFPVRLDELDDRLPRGRGLEGRTGRELRGRDRRRGADRFLGARGERESTRAPARSRGRGEHASGADDTAGRCSLDWARRSRPGGRGRQRSRNVRTPQGRVLGNTQAGRPVESATENRPPRER